MSFLYGDVIDLYLDIYYLGRWVQVVRYKLADLYKFNRYKFISRCDWLIFFGNLYLFCTIIWSRPFSMLFNQIFCLWMLIVHIKVSNFLVEILKLQDNKFLKINKVINETSIITIVPPDIHSSSILISITFGVPSIFVSFFVCCFSLLISLIISANFLFALDNFACFFLIFISKYLTLFPLLVFPILKLFLFWILLYKCWLSPFYRRFMVLISAIRINTTCKFRNESWKSIFGSYELWDQIYELWVQIRRLRVHI